MAEGEPDRDEPLLGAVVEIALDPAALVVAGGDYPRTRGLDLGQLASQLDAQSRDLDRKPTSLDDPAEHGGIFFARSIVEQGREWLGQRVRPGSVARRSVREVADGRPARIDVELAFRQEEEEPESRIRQHVPKDSFHLLGRSATSWQILQEHVHPPQRVEAGAVESAIDPVLHPCAQRTKGDRDDSMSR